MSESSDTQFGIEFSLPEEISAHQEYVDLYHSWVERLLQESAGFPMHTVQTFLLERIASRYVLMRFRERHGSTSSATAERMSFAQWLDMVKEWNKIIAANNESTRDVVIDESMQIALDALQMVEDPVLRDKLRVHFKERFAAIGL